MAAKNHIFLPNCDYSNLSRPIQAGTGVGGQAGGAAGGGGAPGACNNLVNSAQVIDKNHHAEAPPVMTGGTIADGTYFLTAMDKYNGETGTSTHQEVWVYPATPSRSFSRTARTSRSVTWRRTTS